MKTERYTSAAYYCTHLDEVEEKVERYKSDNFLENRRMLMQ